MLDRHNWWAHDHGLMHPVRKSIGNCVANSPEAKDLQPRTFAGFHSKDPIGEPPYVIILGRRHLKQVLEEFSLHYFNTSRPHQGIGQRVLLGVTVRGHEHCRVQRRTTVGRLIPDLAENLGLQRGFPNFAHPRTKAALRAFNDIRKRVG